MAPQVSGGFRGIINRTMLSELGHRTAIRKDLSRREAYLSWAKCQVVGSARTAYKERRIDPVFGAPPKVSLSMEAPWKIKEIYIVRIN